MDIRYIGKITTEKYLSFACNKLEIIKNNLKLL